MKMMMIFAILTCGLVMGPVLIQACFSTTTTPQCHVSQDCTDISSVIVRSYGDCCDSNFNSFRINSLGACIPCNSRGCHMDDGELAGVCSGLPELPGIDSLEECCASNGTSFLGDDGICVSCNSTCYLATGTGSGCTSSQTMTGISFNQCLLNSANNFFSFDGTSSSCTPCISVGCYSGKDCEGEPEIETDELIGCCDQTRMMGSFRNENGECFCLVDGGPMGGDDPHFFLPLANGDNLCFSIQGQPEFMFSLIKDKVCPAQCSIHPVCQR